MRQWEAHLPELARDEVGNSIMLSVSLIPLSKVNRP